MELVILFPLDGDAVKEYNTSFLRKCGGKYVEYLPNGKIYCSFNVGF
jgi:hypothetical protein